MKKTIIFLMVFCLSMSMVMAGSVTRSFSSATTTQGGTVNVTLTVDVNDSDTYYLIDEIYPAGWTVTNNGLGDDTTQPGHISWTLVEGLVPGVVVENTSYTYTLSVPADASSPALFSGEATIEDVINTTNGETSLTLPDGTFPSCDPPSEVIGGKCTNVMGKVKTVLNNPDLSTLQKISRIAKALRDYFSS
jgi:hypothetical protein